MVYVCKYKLNIKFVAANKTEASTSDEPAGEAEKKESNENDQNEDKEEEGDDGLDLNENERACKRIIDQIRRDEFGINVELTEDAQRLMTKQQERLGRSLDRLSKDLYSKVQWLFLLYFVTLYSYSRPATGIYTRCKLL